MPFLPGRRFSVETGPFPVRCDCAISPWKQPVTSCGRRGRALPPLSLQCRTHPHMLAEKDDVDVDDHLIRGSSKRAHQKPILGCVPHHPSHHPTIPNEMQMPRQEWIDSPALFAPPRAVPDTDATNRATYRPHRDEISQIAGCKHASFQLLSGLPSRLREGECLCLGGQQVRAGRRM